MPNEIKQYLQEVQKLFATGKATEHTYRPALKNLIESLVSGSTATNEPKRVECGAPDFIVEVGETPIGHIEAKDVGKNLDDIEETEQLARYFESLPNLILTDYLEFRLYQNSELIMDARLARPGKGGKLSFDKDGPEKLNALFDVFANASMPTVGNPKELANRMAAIARLLRDTMKKALELEDEETGSLHEQLKAFRTVLLNDLEEKQFADMYAQTICYGLFAARCRHNPAKGAFTRESAVFEIPQTNPFLREVFEFIAGSRLDDSLTWAVDHLAYLLDRSDMAAILKDFGKRTKQEDPVVHFYETFLAAYDPALREKRGVYYTPEPVVSYIVRSVDHILKNDFSLPDRLASRETIEINGEKIPQVLILDPAAGTGTFLHGVVDQIHNIMTVEKGMAGAWDSYVSDHLLPRLFGFELLMAPYAVCHLKLAIQLNELGYKFTSGERLRVYLTNTLQEAFDKGDLAMFAGAIAKEANAAGEVKTKAPVMVVLGNPPYSGHSANKSDWIADLLRGKENKQTKATENYFMVDGKPLGEKNPKWLNDDYVKFIRFAQWRIEQTGYGILAFISNHGYLDNPTFRGMRQSLMNTFDDIYLLDLHGNAKKKEKAPDGGRDENVFDIQQGVAIGIFVKKNNAAKNQPAIVFHADLWGVREVVEHDDNGNEMLTGGKYRALYDSDVANTEWKRLKPQSPFYLYVPYDTSYLAEYEKGWKLDQIFPINSVGITTARDKLTIHWTADEVWKTVKDFSALPEEEAREKYQLGKDAKDWKVSLAQEDLLKEGLSKDNIVPMLYRPFDMRWTYFTGKSSGFMCRPRPKVMQNMLRGANLALCTTRNIEIGRGWEHVFCSSAIIQHHTVSIKEVNVILPVYLFHDSSARSDNLMDMIEARNATKENNGRATNISKDFIDNFCTCLKMSWLGNDQGDLKKTFGPEDVFHYIYAVLHSPTYRERYAEYLKMDFPRIPLTSNKKLMRALCALGAELTTLHLMDVNLKTFATFPEKGGNKIERITFDQAKGRVLINKAQYFGNVPQEVWGFHIGGYQVCHKWLKDRKGRVLSFDEIAHYQQILAIIDRTMTLMAEIDEVLDQEGGWPIQ